MEGRTQYLAFLVGGDEYAVPILGVREIVAFEQATRVPATPSWIRGVVNLRGQVLPVVDLSVKFGLGPTPVGPRTCVIVFELPMDDQVCAVGALVEAVSQVLELAEGDVEPPPEFGTQIRVDYLAGAALSGGRFSLLLDSEKVLRADELLALREAGEAAPSGATAAAGGATE